MGTVYFIAVGLSSFWIFPSASRLCGGEAVFPDAFPSSLSRALSPMVDPSAHAFESSLPLCAPRRRLRSASNPLPYSVRGLTSPSGPHGHPRDIGRSTTDSLPHAPPSWPARGFVRHISRLPRDGHPPGSERNESALGTNVRVPPRAR